MPQKVLTVVKDGVTSTLGVNRDILAGVTTLSKTSGTVPLTDDTTSIQVTVAGHADISGIYTGTTVAGATWNQQGGVASISASGFNETDGYEYLLQDGDSDPQILLNTGAGFTDRPWKAVIPSSITITGIASTETLTVNRTADSGGGTMTATTPLSDGATSIQVTVAGHADLSGIYNLTSGGSGFDWAQQGGHGQIVREQNSQYNYHWLVYDNSDGNPYSTFGSGLVSETDSRPWKPANTGIVTIASVPETLTVNRFSDRKGESRPLLSKLVGGAAAAYSLRDLNDKAGNNKVVRVRRSSDNAEKDFIASEMGKVLEDWVGVGNDGFLKTWYDQTESRTDDPQNITGFLVERSNDIMDGEWDKVADVNGKVAFTHEDDANRTLNWTGTRWEFKDSSTVYYYSTVDTTYPFDVSNVWVAVEGSGTPDFESFDGGWYDPLGRGGMLTMHAEIFQPMIVRNGTYLGEIDFDESNDKLNAHFELDIDPADSGFASIVVARVDSTDTTSKQILLQNSSSGSRHLIQWQANGRYQFYAKDAEGDTKTFITNASFGNDEYKVFTTTIDSNSLCRANVNGFGEVNHWLNESVDFGSVDSTVNSDEVISPSGTPFMGAVKEMIFYLSDQSANRPAIEANINNQYDIY